MSPPHVEDLRRIALSSGEVSSAWIIVPSSTRPWFVYTPGAGAGLNDPFGKYLATHLYEHGVSLVRFQFPYAERGLRRPDAPAVLLETWRAVLATVRKEQPDVVAGGRSMGGRIASMVAAEGYPLAGLALFAYPLYPPGNRGDNRKAHLPNITVPTFFCSGTRDNFGTPDELREAAGLIPNAELHFLEGADHGFKALKSSGRTREDMWAGAVEALHRWFPG